MKILGITGSSPEHNSLLKYVISLFDQCQHEIIELKNISIKSLEEKAQYRGLLLMDVDTAHGLKHNQIIKSRPVFLLSTDRSSSKLDLIKYTKVWASFHLPNFSINYDLDKHCIISIDHRLTLVQKIKYVIYEKYGRKIAYSNCGIKHTRSESGDECDY